METILLDCGAGGPQLKRHPLGSTAREAPVVRAHVVLTCIIALYATIITRPLSPRDQPPIEFTVVDDDSAGGGPPIIEDCGYYLRIRGTAAHNGGSRLGAAVQLRNDSLFVTITSYRASEFVPHDWQPARWTLLIGGLESERYHVRVLAASHHLERDVRLSFGTASCAA